ncbi:hypothetical protein [Chromobacterium sphagni]|uniref:hypothetical protein n=1 Tax=Chromobacterium sphagni TaxID=1903179 RepID=UPI0011141720|nr:hypothetical protein [Chromobacterium sphagni]
MAPLQIGLLVFKHAYLIIFFAVTAVMVIGHYQGRVSMLSTDKLCDQHAAFSWHTTSLAALAAITALRTRLAALATSPSAIPMCAFAIASGVFDLPVCSNDYPVAWYPDTAWHHCTCLAKQ